MWRSLLISVLALSVGATPAAAAACPGARPAASAECQPNPPPATDHVPDLNALRTPESPAFHALGLAASDIQRPATPVPGVAALANGVAKGQILPLLQNVGLELSPYWSMRRPNLTREDLEDDRAWSIARDATISLALTHRELDLKPVDGVSSKEDTALTAVGVRTTLWPGSASDEALECQEYLIREAERDAVGVLQFGSEELQAWEAVHPRPALRPYDVPEPKIADPKYRAPNCATPQECVSSFNADLARWREQQDKKFASANPELLSWLEERHGVRQRLLQQYERERPRVDTPRQTQCRQLVHDRRGFVANVAGALVVRAPGGDLKRGKELAEGGHSLSGWLTLGVLLEQWSLLLSLRRTHDAQATAEDLFDLGGRLIYSWERVGVSAEGTYRRQLDTKEDLYRIAIGLDYRLSGGMWATVVLGKDFGAVPSEAPLIGLANLQYHFGLERGITPDSARTP